MSQIVDHITNPMGYDRSFGSMMVMMQDHITPMLRPQWYSVRVEGSQTCADKEKWKGCVGICFFFFRDDNTGYDIEILHPKSFRLYRPDGDPSEELVNFNNILSSIVPNLGKYLVQ